MNILKHVIQKKLYLENAFIFTSCCSVCYKSSILMKIYVIECIVELMEVFLSTVQRLKESYNVLVIRKICKCVI